MAVVAKYALQTGKDYSSIQVFDGSSKLLAQFWFRFNGTLSSPVKVPATGTWPATAYLRVDVTESHFQRILDLLRNEGPTGLDVDQATPSINWTLGTNFEPIGEGEL